MMKKRIPFLALLLALPLSAALEAEDTRELVQLPEMMQTRMLAHMRDHLAAIHEIMAYLSADDLEAAADTAERRLGMGSMQARAGGGGGRMGQHMPEAMRAMGRSMHSSASSFALKAREGDVLAAYKAISPITSACVACHTSFRIR
jgi:hypothetical protein